VVGGRGWLPDNVGGVTNTDRTGAAVSTCAKVVTDTPARYAKQLVAHLGHKVDFTIDGPTSTARIGGGTGSVVVGEGLLTLVAQGPDESVTALVEHVLGTHLERFGTRNELSVAWQATNEPTP
jgi:uncharacterized protein